jgi:hypothetical protein
MELFRESRDRLARAKMHRNAFADHWNALIEHDAISIIVEFNPDRTGVIKFQRKSPYVNDASLELGEFFYQLRAALDCLAFTAVRQKTGDPVSKEDSIYFPIADTVSRYDKQVKNLGAIPEQLRLWIKSVQPCFAGENTDEPIGRISLLLELLHNCARKDRHRRLTVLAPGGSELCVEISFTPHVEIEHIDGVSCNLFDNEGVLAKFKLAEYVPGLNVDLKGDLYIDVILENIHFSGWQFADALDRIGRVVDYAISQFEAAFRS